MERVSISEATVQLPELISQLTENREPVVIETEGKAVAVLITYEQLEKILAIEDNQELIEKYILSARQQMIVMKHEIVGLQTQNRRIQEYFFGENKAE